MPRLLRRLNYKFLTAELCAQSLKEQDALMRRTIDDLLAGVAERDELSAWFNSPDSNRRKLACRVWSHSPTDEFLGYAKNCLVDSESSVANEAISAMRMWRDRVSLDVNVDRFIAERESYRKWTLLDEIIAVGYPGEECGIEPPWIKLIRSKCSPLMRSYFGAEVEKAREKLQKRK